MRIPAVLLLLPLVLAHAATPLRNSQHRRHHASLIARQGRPDPDENDQPPIGGGKGDDDDDELPSPTPSVNVPPIEPSSVLPTPSAEPTTTPPPRPTPKPTQDPDPTSSVNNKDKDKDKDEDKDDDEEPSRSQSSTRQSIAPSSTRGPTSSAATEDDDLATASPSAAVTSDTDAESASSTTSRAAATPSRSASTGLSIIKSTHTATTKPKSSTSTTGKPTSTAASSETEEESSGLAKPALVAIIVICSLVGAGVIIWTLFRKLKLRPSDRFDERNRPVSYRDSTEMDNTYLEKPHVRSESDAADRQRQEFVADLDKDGQGNGGLVGDINHDFTAGPTPIPGVGAYGYQTGPYGEYQPHDQYGNPVAYEAGAFPQDQYTPQYDQNGYPQQYYPQPGAQQPQPQYGNFDAPTQDEGYNQMHREPAAVPAPATAPAPYSLPSDFAVSGRPTGGEGPYAQAAAYRY